MSDAHGAHVDVRKAEEAIAALRQADADLQNAREDVAEIGEDAIAAVADACERLRELLASYEGRATGTGDFRAFVEFQEKVTTLVEDLPEDLPERDTFEAIESALDKRRLSEADFDRARDALAPAAAVAGRRERQRDALASYREARRTVERELAAVDERIEDCRRLLDLGDADLDAPVEELRDPIETYDEAVREVFADFRAHESARDVLDLVDLVARDYPLVPFRSPPDDLREYVDRSPDGERSIPDLLDLADYSTAKLSHHVADPGELKRRVATNRTYLERLDAGPMTLGWPPEPARTLRWRIRELIAVCGRFDATDAIGHLRELRGRAREEDEYERLRTAARAREELTPGERDRLASGAVEEELEEALAARERLEAALVEFPVR